MRPPRIKDLIPAPLRSYARRLVAGSGRPEPPGRLAEEAGRYWSASREQDLLRDLSHWRGRGRWTEERWRRIGDDHFARYDALRALAGRSDPVRTMLEWGPGGGANATRFAGEVAAFIGVDISAANLEECRRQFEARGGVGFRGVLIDPAAPEGVLEHVPGGSVDFFLSTAVFQHFPGKPYGARVTALAGRLLADGGIALIQTRYDDGSAAFRPKDRDYRRHAITFTSYRVEEYWQLAADSGLEPLAVALDPAVNYAFYYLRRAPRAG